MERTLDVIGTRPAMLVLREAFYGTTRFDDFVRRTNMAQPIIGTRLKELTEIGVFTRQPYQEPGERTRREYLLTEKGRDLLPAVFALMQWGNKYLQSGDGGPLRLVEQGTGEPRVVGLRTASGRDLEREDLAIVANGDWAETQLGVRRP
jgi:DNA-binding HxlR family transcriptional regulator